jgi:hypothetical protein
MCPAGFFVLILGSSVSYSYSMPFAAVLSLGRVEWVHPGFHDEKHIWPAGYAAERLVATPASQVSLLISFSYVPVW